MSQTHELLSVCGQLQSQHDPNFWGQFVSRLYYTGRSLRNPAQSQFAEFYSPGHLVVGKSVEAPLVMSSVRPSPSTPIRSSK